jgi:spore maturation protein SpmB
MNRRNFLVTAGAGTVGVGTLGMAGCNPSQWLTIALNDLPTILQIVTSIISIVGAGSSSAAAVALAQTASNKAKDAINEALAFLQQYQTNKTNTLLGNVDDALATAQAQLGSILGVLGINNPTLQATLAAAIGSALTIIVAVQTLIPAPVPTPTPTPTPAQQRRVKLTAARKAASTDQSIAIKVGYNEALAAAGGSQYAI